MKYAKQVTIAVVLIGSLAARAQVGPPPPPPPGGNPPPPLGLPPVPPENPITAAKANLGKALFWDEQLSSTRTVSCGTCHIPARGGSDQRSLLGSTRATHPGVDLIFGNADDITGSPGVQQSSADGAFVPEPSFGIREQVTKRKSPSFLNAGFPQRLFWDGRAGDEFRDPITNANIAPHMSALESQVLGPPTNSVEMAHLGRDWNDVAQRVATSLPLALSPQLPAELENWIADRNYPALFNEAFGSPNVTPVRIAMAIATYERTLNTNQAPIDLETANNPTLTQLENQGRDVFRRSGCAGCHAGPRLTDDRFHYTGVRPVTDDLGRFAETGDNGDRGAMKTPELRNLELHAPYMHNGRFNTVEEVVDFYNRGGDFDAPNKDRRVRPLGLSQQDRAALAAFLKHPLTDPRVAAEQAPFDRPLLYTESNRRPQNVGPGTTGSGGIAPRASAIEPPYAGNPAFTVGVFDALGGAAATLIIDSTDPGTDANLPPAPSFARVDIVLAGNGAGHGTGSATLSIPGSAALIGAEFFGRWYIADPGASGGVAVSPAFHFQVFDAGQPLASEGEGEGEGATEGEGEGEGEGSAEGEGEGEGEGSAEGEGEGEGEGSAEGEGEGEGEGSAEGEGEGEGEITPPEHPHTCDENGDGRIQLNELLRGIQFLNSGGLHCGAGTEDGFAPGPGDNSCVAHASDYNPQDWKISLAELLRLIQFYNSNSYSDCEGTEDGFCAGQPG